MYSVYSQSQMSAEIHSPKRGAFTKLYTESMQNIDGSLLSMHVLFKGAMFYTLF